MASHLCDVSCDMKDYQKLHIYSHKFRTDTVSHLYVYAHVALSHLRKHSYMCKNYNEMAYHPYDHADENLNFQTE